MSRPVVLIHGYSDSSDSFQQWIDQFKDICSDQPNFSVHLCDYRTLTNEISLKDIAEGFDRALRNDVKLGNGQEFDAIVHSTGMLVIRAWLTSYKPDERQGRLKHLVALAPATFGSPLAKKGRSWLGAIFKGNRDLGPDFLDAGDQILDALELASPHTWELAHKDLLSPKPFYGPGSETPYVFTFCGTSTYGFVTDIVTNEQGSDGTVRWAGCVLNTRKITIDLSFDDTPATGTEADRQRVAVSPWSNIEIPFIPIEGMHHGDIIKNPDRALVSMVADALQVSDQTSYEAWCAKAGKQAAKLLKKMTAWQQFIVRAVDERGDPIPDYYIQLYMDMGNDTRNKLYEFAMDVSPYSKDPSYRCFHVNLDELAQRTQVNDISTLDNLWLRIMATTGTRLVGYTGYGAEEVLHDGSHANRPGAWDAKILIPQHIKDEDGNSVSFFHPFTTTLVEIILNREPFPFEINKPNDIACIQECWAVA
ncbi:MAG TPA: hypothetical protein PLE99_10155 [Candidatus Thiothrix moscowensis]|uniref:esterase/lipase family protein n=1 Tax=Thiothrix sp. UBA2016 TaxID=1947695 RepID=UPI0025CD1464|nr:hypothetical protein [Thiothrix sp. UBA2016]HRJ53122.1 hypothetical protein [Candidatus Thiothrix moscowensis]HRJ93113.1 hypothetical protein [Candidatus Thiothrix moscowensis]